MGFKVTVLTLYLNQQGWIQVERELHFMDILLLDILFYFLGLSKVFENAFMFSDLLLQRPKAIHGIYDEHQDWQDSLKWAYQVCFKSGVFSGQEQEYLDLV